MRYVLLFCLACSDPTPSDAGVDASGDDAGPPFDAGEDSGLPRVTVTLTNVGFDGANDFALVAIQSGDGEWTPVIGEDGVYEANVSEGRYSWLWVCEAYGGRVVFVHATTGEGTDVAQPCRPAEVQRAVVSGSFLNAPDTTSTVLAEATLPVSGTTGYGIEVVPGTQDVVAISSPALLDVRMVVERGAAIAGATTLDFDFAGAVALELAPITITNGDGTGNVFSRIATQGGFDEMVLVGDPTAVLVIPAALRMPDDLHVVWAENGSESAFRTVRSTEDLALTIPETWEAASGVSIVTTDPFTRPATAFAPQPDADLFRIWYGDGDDDALFAYVTQGWLGDEPVHVYEIPDPSALDGWDPEWVDRDASYTLYSMISAISGDASPLEHVCEDETGLEEYSRTGPRIDQHRGCGERLLDDVGRERRIQREIRLLEVP